MPRPPYEVVTKERAELKKDVSRLEKENTELAEKLAQLRERQLRLDDALSASERRVKEMEEELQKKSGEGLQRYQDLSLKMIKFIHGKVDKCCRHKASATRCERFSCMHLLAAVMPIEKLLVDDGKMTPYVLWRPKKTAQGLARAGTAESLPGQVPGFDWETASILPEVTDVKLAQRARSYGRG